jgi:predicted nucleic acid-binding protein
MSAVVLQELTAGSKDSAEIRTMRQYRQRYEADGQLLVPTGEDWWTAGKVLSSLRRGVKSHKRGRVPAIPKEEQQRILRDVLIACTARRANAAVVTENVADFKKIQNYCNVRILPPQEFF